MVSTYNYSLFIRINGEKADLVLPKLPFEEIRLIEEHRSAKKRSLNLMVPLGLPRERIVDLLEWFEKLEELVTSYTLFDPQLGRTLELPKDDEALLESILAHDAWILDNVGGDSYAPGDHETSLLPPRTKLLIWFVVIIIMLYFLTRLALSSYFGS